MLTWEDICGERQLLAIRTDIRHPFNSEANGVALDLGDLTVFVFEDPNDGYRSAAASPLFAKGSLCEFGVSPDYIRAPVRIEKWRPRPDEHYSGECEGLRFIDTRNGKTVLLLGTSNTDDYYPSFVCDWQPQNLAVTPRT